jgi:hypothetical protein
VAAANDIRRSAAALLLFAGVGLAFELTLTRLFSLLFQYHYVFLVVSLSVLGLGLGAGLGYFVSRGRMVGEGIIGLSAMLLALLFPLTARMLAHLDSADVTLGSLFFPWSLCAARLNQCSDLRPSCRTQQPALWGRSRSVRLPD